MTNNGDRFVVTRKMPHNFDYPLIQSDIFWGTSTGDYQSIVTGFINVVEGGIDLKVVPWFFAVGLVTFKIVNGGANLVACFFVRANGMYGMPHHLQCMKRHHHFIILTVVA